jgi:hypothetical protein
MTALARTSSNCKLQTHPLVRENVTKGYESKYLIEKKIAGRESEGACRQDEMMGGKSTVVKYE